MYLCSYQAICSDLIMTQLSSAARGGVGYLRTGRRGRGGVCTSLSRQRERGGEGLAALESLEAWVPQGVPTPCHCPAHPHLEDTPSPITGSGRNLPYRPRWPCPSLSSLQRRQGWQAGESGVGRTGEGLCVLLGQCDDTAHVCAWTQFSPDVGMGLQH